MSDESETFGRSQKGPFQCEAAVAGLGSIPTDTPDGHEANQRTYGALQIGCTPGRQRV